MIATAPNAEMESIDHLPKCVFYNMEQRSPAWYEIRKGVLTASKVGDWLAEQPECRMTVAEIKEALDEEGISYKGKTKRDDLLELLPEVRRHLSLTQSTMDATEKAILKILGQQSSVQPPYEFTVDMNDEHPPSNIALWAIWNGIKLEPEATAAFEWETGEKLQHVGFAKSIEWDAGCSPDGLVAGKPIGFEGKAPLPHTHLKYLFDGKLPDDYKMQVHFSMAVTGAEAWWFQSYCPGLPTFRTLVERDETTERVERGLESFTNKLAEAQEKLKQFN